MLLGEFSHTLDTKNRVMLPVKLRDQLGSDVVIAKSFDPCLTLFSAEGWKAYCEKLDSLPAMETRFAKRFLYPSAFETTVDGQGRVLIPAELCTYAELKKDVTVLGLGDHIEFWNPDGWKTQKEAVRGEQVAETLMKLGF